MGLWQIVGALSGRCAKGHKFGGWRTKNGWKTRTCSRCGTTETTISLAKARAAGTKRRAARR